MSIQEHLNKIRNAIYGREVRESIAKGIETAYDDASENGNANMEVKIARGTHPNLRSRLEEVDNKQQQTTAQLAQAESKKLNRGENESISMSMLNPDIKQAINDGEWNVSVNTSDIENRAITLPKINLDGYLPMSFVFTVIGSNNRAEINEYFSESVTIHATNGIQISGAGGITTGWSTSLSVPADTNLRLRARFSDDSAIGNRLEFINNNVWAITPDTAVKRREFTEKFDSMEEELRDGYLTFDLTYKFGSPSPTSSSILRASSSFFSSRNTIYIESQSDEFELTILEILDKTTGEHTVLTQSWGQRHTIDAPGKSLSVYVRRVDGEYVTSQQLQDFPSIVSVGVRLGDNGNGDNNERKLVKYVSLDGSDGYTGNSAERPYKTLSKALNEVSNGVIYIEAGEYKEQAIVAEVEDVSILAYNNKNDSGTKKDLAVFRGSDTLSDFEVFNSIYRVAYSGNNRFDRVFVNKDLPIESDASRPTFNAVLWEGNNDIDDYKMTPVLTLAECENQVGTFHYDGTHVYVNPQNINNEFNAVNSTYGLNISGGTVKMKDLVFDFYNNVPINVDDLDWVEAENCEGSHSSANDGWSIDNASGEFTRCRAFKNRNDGFNLHNTGDTTFTDCEGMYNYDDGISHHEVCTGTIIGGRWSHNHKGGVMPVNHSKVNLYNAVIENNRYGFYADADNLISSGNLYKNNEIGIRSGGANMTSVNDTFVENDADTSGNVNIY